MCIGYGAWAMHRLHALSLVQVDLACRELHEAHGRPPLLVMPPEYMSEATVPNHTSSNPANQAREQEVTLAERAYMRAWRAGGVGLWVCPEGTSDDWYWMYATVVVGAEARVLSNDEMRDHAFRMLAPSYFARCALGLALDEGGVKRGRKPRCLWRRWRARHLVRFDFSHGASHDRPEPMLTLTEPPAFSGVCTGLSATTCLSLRVVPRVIWVVPCRRSRDPAELARLAFAEQPARHRVALPHTEA